MKILKHLPLTIMLLLLMSTSFYSTQIDEGEEYLAYAEQMPQPVGGLPAIYKKIKYPKIAKDAGLQGKVYLLAFIDSNGSVNQVKVIKGIGGGCDEAAANAIKQCKFTPGKSNGKNVKVKMSLQIQFKLN